MTSSFLVTLGGVVSVIAALLQLGQTLKIVTPGRRFAALPGNQVTLPCLVLGKDFNMFYNPIVWYKVLDGNQIQINTGGVINPEFKHGHSIKVNATATSVDLPLTITDISLSENGTYQCDLKQKDGSTMSSTVHRLEVHVSIEEVDLWTNVSIFERDSNKHSLDLQLLEPTFVRCKSYGGNPRPVLSLYRGETNISSEFKKVYREERRGAPGHVIIKYEQQLVNSGYRADKDYSGQALRCVASIPGRQDSAMSDEAVMRVHYPPMFLCKSKHSAFPDTPNYSITCKVKANPPVHLESVIWTVDDGDIKLQAGDENGVYSTSTSVISDSEVETELTIALVNHSHYQPYHLAVSNALGERRFKFLLSPAKLETKLPEVQEPKPRYEHTALTVDAGAVCSQPTLMLMTLTLACLWASYR